MQNLTLPIHDMEQRHWGLTQATAAYWTEGARVSHAYPLSWTVIASAAWQSRSRSAPIVALTRLPRRYAPRNDKVGTHEARVCLDRHHQSPVAFQIGWAELNADALVEWEHTDERTRGAWADRVDTTEAGAYACVLAAVELLQGLVAVRRAEQLTGADYYVAPPGTASDDFESMMRLEVAGRDRATASGLASLLECKLQQAEDGDSNLPAIAGVVGFRAPVMLLANLEE